jgi:hypothetical protein
VTSAVIGHGVVNLKSAPLIKSSLASTLCAGRNVQKPPEIRVFATKYGLFFETLAACLTGYAETIFFKFK